MSPADLRCQLARAEAALSAPDECAPAVPPVLEAVDLAREVASSFGRMVRYYRDYYKLPHAEAVARAGAAAPEYAERMLAAPPDEVTWGALECISGHDPEQALRLWAKVKGAARQELRSGLRAARAAEGVSGEAWPRAQFLAVRSALTEAWGPRDEQEQMLIDQLAQWQAMMEQWQEALVGWMGVVSAGGGRERAGAAEPNDYWSSLPRVTEAEGAELAGAMVERFHRLYLRTLRALQDLRRRVSAVVVRRAGQVNIGQQQVNVSPS